MENEYNNIVNQFAEDIAISPDLLPATNYSLAHNPRYYLLNEASSFEDEIRKLMWPRPKIPIGYIDRNSVTNIQKLSPTLSHHYHDVTNITVTIPNFEPRPYSRVIQKPLDIPENVQSNSQNDTNLVAAMNSLSLHAEASRKPKTKDMNSRLRPSNFWNLQLFAIEKKEIIDPFWTELWLKRHWPSQTAAENWARPRQATRKLKNSSNATRLARPRKNLTPRNVFAAQNQTLRFPFSRPAAEPSRQKTNRLTQ